MHGPPFAATLAGMSAGLLGLLRLTPAALSLLLSILPLRAGTVLWSPELTSLALRIALAIYLGAWVANARAWPRRLAPALLLLCIGSVLGCGVMDDAYISLRYARNLSDGHGLVFNLGERVEGYTSFAWVVLLSAANTICGWLRLPSLARWLGVGCALFSVWMADRTADRIGAPGRPSDRTLPPAGLQVLMVVHFPLVFWAFSGMETGLYVALLTASIYFFCNYLLVPDSSLRLKQVAAAAGLLVGATLTRPETYLLFLGYLPFVIAREGKLLSRSMLVFAATTIPPLSAHVLWRLAYYGYPFPNTYYAKIGAPFTRWEDGLDYLIAGLLGHGLFFPFALEGMRGSEPRALARRFVSTLALLVAASVLVVGGDNFGEWRYFVYLLPLLYALGRDGLARALAALIPNALARRAPRIAGSQALALAALSCFFTTFLLGSVGPQSTLYFGAREAERWAEVGRWLASHAAPGDLVATPVIGAIGYYSQRPVLDLLGLTDATIAHAPVRNESGPKGHLRSNPRYVLRRRPKYIYLMSDAPSEQAFLHTRHWIPAVNDLRRFFPRADYRYELHRSPHVTYAFYVRRD